MSTNGVNGEDTEMAECEGEKVVTMMDVLKEQQEFEEDANAVLGASDDKNCTYSKGYIKRQAVYACLTCCNDAKHDPDKRAGVCLACSLTCHENHDLVELYTKRNFRCDCGNPKFNHPCQYTENKTSLNDDNIYNQNFSGLYCTCHRPYPDPDGVEEEMIQCIVCEDWLHSSHLEATVPSPELYAEMICKDCMDKNDFLHDYGKYAVNGDVDIVGLSESDDSKQYNGNTNDVNGVNAKTDGAESEQVNDSDKLTEVDNSTEAINTSHNNTEEINPKEQMQQDLPVTDRNVEGNEEENLATPIKTCDESSMANDLAKDIVSNNADNVDPTEENQLKDNQEDKSSSDANSVTLGDNPDIVTSSGDQENLDVANDKNDGTADVKVADQNLTENPIGAPQDSNVGDANGDHKAEDGNDGNAEVKVTNQSELESPIDAPQDSNVGDANGDHKAEDGNDGNAEVKVTNQSELESPIDAPQDSNVGDANGDHKAEDGNDGNAEVKVTNQSELESPIDAPQESNGGDAIEEKQDLTVSTVTSADNTNVETLPVTDNNIGDEEIKENKRKLSSEDSTRDVSAKKPKLSESDCLRPQGERKMFKGATFWPCHFRQKLCTCNECITMYKDLSVLFLIDPEDTVTAYEVLGKEKTDGAASTQYEKGLEALSSLGRIQQINALTEYNKMRDKLLDFLKSFKDRKEVVKEEDIKAFFAGMKPKREPDGVYFCR